MWRNIVRVRGIMFIADVTLSPVRRGEMGRKREGGVQQPGAAARRHKRGNQNYWLI